MREGMPLRDGMSPEHHIALGGNAIRPRPRLRAALLDALADNDLVTLEGGELAARAGLPEAVFGEHYRDVDELFLDAYDELTRQARERFRQNLEDASGDWRDRLAAAVDAEIEEVFSSPGVARALLLEAGRSADPALQRRRAAARERFVALVTPADDSASGRDVPCLHAEFLVGALARAAGDELAASGDCASAARRVRELLALFEPIAA